MIYYQIKKHKNIITKILKNKMTKSEQKIAKKFIEQELHFSFNMSETKRIANFILKGVEFGADLFNKKIDYILNNFTQQELANRLAISQWELLEKLKNKDFNKNEISEIEKIINEINKV